MLIGFYEHTVDQKNRFNFPFKLREALGEKFVISQGMDGCLFAYSNEEWQNLADKMRDMPMVKTKKLQRMLFANATEAEPDKQGRVIIPAHLKKYADIEKNIVVIGVSNRVEIWAAERYYDEDRDNPEEMDDLSREMAELGL